MAVKIGIFLVAVPVLAYAFAFAYEGHYLSTSQRRNAQLPERPQRTPVEISIDAATYGANCGAQSGNATNDLALSCNGKASCTYSVQVQRIGDPDPGCAKNFSVTYSCLPEAKGLHRELPGEAGLGSVLDLDCTEAHRAVAAPANPPLTQAEARPASSEFNSGAKGSHGLYIRSATYGANCGAAAGNATQDVASSCNGKTQCDYSVRVDHLGDPAPKCAKDFVASYSCAPGTAVLQKQVPAEAGFGRILSLSCAPAATKPSNAATVPSSGLYIRSATYGANCGAAAGNATQDVASSCNGKTQCDYSVRVDHLGDPAPKCAKDFVASYSCAPGTAVLQKQVPAEAGFGRILSLSCAPAATKPSNAATVPSSGLYIRSATYGANCGAAAGNATQDVASSCNGKTQCDYSVRVDHLGDPAPKCAKDFVASYSCAPGTAVLQKHVPAEAGFGHILSLSCALKMPVPSTSR